MFTIDIQRKSSQAQRRLLWQANDGVKVIEAFECFPVMTAVELALCAGIADEEAASYLLTLEHLGLAETDGESFWLNTVMDTGPSCRGMAPV
jgi:hypothetical protein